jgi:methyl-accepting chemotaxis protein
MGIMTKKKYLKSRSFFLIIIFALIAISCFVFLHQKELAQAKELYIAQTDSHVFETAAIIHEKFKTAYETVRTVSLLPGVIEIESPGQLLASDTKGSIQQLYNNAFLNIQLSEIYILPKNFDYLKTNPVTNKKEEPLAIFDELVTKSGASPSNKGKGFVEEVESYEYELYKQQFQYFNNFYPTNTNFKRLEIPMLSGAEIITCDNSEFSQFDLDKHDDSGRKGIVFTVPKYNKSGNLNGAVSAVLRSNVIEKFLPVGSFGLINRDYKNKIIKSPSESWRSSIPDFESKKINPKLIYSKIVPINTSDLHKWELWVALPDSLFFQTEIYKKVQTIFKIELIAIFLFVLLMIKTTFTDFKNNNKIEQLATKLVLSADQLNSTADELNNASQSIKKANEQQTTSAVYIASVVTDMTEMTKKSSENVEVLLRITERNSSATNQSQKNISDLTAVLLELEKTELQILQQIDENGARLNEIMRFISEIKSKTNQIDDIVFQTKLLSFNASVEASRAGEQGKGFSIVAEEVGKLAAISGLVSKEIKDMLTDGIEKVGNLVENNSKEMRELLSESGKNIDQGSLLSNKCVSELKAMASISEEVQFKTIIIRGVIKEQELALLDITESSSFFKESINTNIAKNNKTFEIAKELISDSRNVNDVIILLNQITKS